MKSQQSSNLTLTINLTCAPVYFNRTIQASDPVVVAQVLRVRKTFQWASAAILSVFIVSLTAFILCHFCYFIFFCSLMAISAWTLGFCIVRYYLLDKFCSHTISSIDLQLSPDSDVSCVVNTLLFDNGNKDIHIHLCSKMNKTHTPLYIEQIHSPDFFKINSSAAISYYSIYFGGKLYHIIGSKRADVELIISQLLPESE